MSFRKRRKIIEGSTDIQAPTVTQDAFKELQKACEDRASAAELLKNKIFVALLDYFDVMEEKDDADLRGLMTPERTNQTRGRLEYFKMFRSFTDLINQR